MFTDLFGNHPFAPNAKKPACITKNMAVPYIAPIGSVYLSDINLLYFSTNNLTVGMFQLAPGSCYDSADIHAGDEAYYMLEGILTVQNPETGEFIQMKKGESTLVPMYGYHKGYNFEQSIMRVLFAIAPNVPAGDFPVVDYSKTPMKMFKSNFNDKGPKNDCIQEWNLRPTADNIGKWPIPGPEARKDPIFFYHIPENKKLISVYGAKHPMLIKFFVSNDILHMGEFILPAGGSGCRASEPITHQGDCGLYVEKGPVAVYLTKTCETFNVQEGDVMFIPPNTEYQLINFSSDNVKVIFSISPGL